MQAKLIVAILTNDEQLRRRAIGFLEEVYGETDLVGEDHPFTHSQYYLEEMGADLSRSIISFQRTISPTLLPQIKLKVVEIEDQFRREGKRQVNLDPGYVDFNKVILASAKGGHNMLLVADQVFLDFTLHYNKGWQPLPWTYPDFRSGIYNEDLEEIRSILKQQAKSA